MSEGDVQMVLDIREGKVVQEFQMPMKRVIYDPENVEAIARTMMELAFEADTSLKPVGDALKADLIEQHRMLLTQRLSIVLNSQRDKKTVSNGKLAQELVEICLKEIF